MNDIERCIKWLNNEPGFIFWECDPLILLETIFYLDSFDKNITWP